MNFCNDRHRLPDERLLLQRHQPLYRSRSQSLSWMPTDLRHHKRLTTVPLCNMDVLLLLLPLRASNSDTQIWPRPNKSSMDTPPPPLRTIHRTCNIRLNTTTTRTSTLNTCEIESVAYTAAVSNFEHVQRLKTSKPRSSIFRISLYQRNPCMSVIAWFFYSAFASVCVFSPCGIKDFSFFFPGF